MAGRIPEQFIDDLIARTDLVEIINSRVKLKRAGKNYVACCPFHQEKTPSFTVSPQKQFYYCFGCGASGNAVGFLMDYDRLGFVDAIENLAKSAGVEVPREGGGQDRGPNLKPLYDLLDKASQYYESQLKNPQVRERAISYLKKRGLTGETAKQFAIGFAPAGWDNLIKHLDADDRQKELLVIAGLAVKNDRGRIYDRFRDRIMFPIRDPRGRTIGFGGRVLGDDKPKYLNSPETPVFYKSKELYGLYEARQQSRKITRHLVVEGYMDVVALSQFGIHYGVATLGTASNQEHLEKLFKQVSEVIFCFDGDEAGRNAARRALEVAIPTLKDGREVKFLFLPEGDDPDTMVRREGPEVFEDLVSKAQPLSEFFYQALSDGLDINSLDGKARLAKIAAPHIERIPKGIFRQLMLDRLASITELSSSTLEQNLHNDVTPISEEPPAPENYDGYQFDGPTSFDQFEDYGQYDQGAPPGYEDNSQPQPFKKSGDWKGKGKGKFKKSGDWKGKKRDFDFDQPISNAPVPSLVDSIIRLALHSPKEAAQYQIPETVDSLGTPFSDLLKALFEALQNRPEISTASLLGRWHDTQDGEHLAALAAKEFLLDESHQIEELQQALKRLEAAIVDAQLDELISEGVQDKTKLRELLNLKKSLTEKP
ncbi:MAG: DNA primase [Pseudomonadales bacterium]|nr:DNA primase [Pseudomonadales bacterium]